MRDTLVIFVFSFLLGSGEAFAEPAAEPPPMALKAVRMPTAPELARPPSEVSDGEKLRQGASAVAAIRDAMKEVLSKLEEARRGHDIVRVNCINEKLVHIRGLLLISNKAGSALQEAISRKEVARGELVYTQLILAKAKAKGFRKQADECVGELSIRNEESPPSELEDPKTPGIGDPTHPSPPAEVVVRPPPASPTL